MNQPCGRRGFASGGFNPSTSGINQEKRDVSIFQRFLGNRDGSVQSNGNPRGSGRGGRGGYRGGRGGGFNSFATGGNQERHDNDSNNRGRGGYRGGRGGGFNSSTSGGNQERREGSIFQRFLGSSNGTSNPFTSGSNQENNGRDSNRDGRGGYRGGRGGGFNPFATGGIQDRHEPAQNGFAANRGGTFNQFNSGNDQDRHGYDSNNPGRGGYRGGRGGGFNAFATGANQEIVGHTSNRDDFAQLNGNPRGSYRGGRGAYRGQRRISGHQNQADGNQNVDDNILDNNVYVPHNRISEELFAEDQKAEALYANVVDDDEDVVVENFDQSLFRLMKWEDAEFEQQLLTNVKERAKHIRPRKIQSVTIPLVIDRFDVICQVETGSGKTAAYLLSIIDDIMKGKLCKDDDTFVSEAASPFAIIIVPTRELAQQIYEQALKFADKTGVSIAKAYGKYHLEPNNNEIRFGCDVLVGTPGRLMHFIKSGEVRVKKLRTFVLDEADRLCDDEFVKDILEIVNIPGFPEVKKRQTLFFSATFPPEVISMKENIMVSEAVFVKNLHMLPNKRIKQDFILVNAQSKLDLLADLLLAEAEKAGGVEEMRRTLVFVNTKQMSDMAALFLCQRGIRALSINDDRPQHIREQALAEFRSRKVPVLCATDVIERGIDIKELDHTVTYIHRIGRTGRITQGYATTFFAGDEPLLYEIAKMLRENNEEVPETLKAAIAAIAD